jgi:hypothetical protein
MWNRSITAPRLVFASSALAVVNFVVWQVWLDRGTRDQEGFLVAVTVIAALQLLAGLVAIAAAATDRARSWPARIGWSIAGLLLAAGAPLGWFFALVSAGLNWARGAWGRPLRVRGRQLHPELRRGSAWARGARPEPHDLDDRHRRALEALWLHDAQKEHASVPAFARVAWLLAAVGAPPELHRRVLAAGIEEIDHAERCFALAAGYGGRSHAADGMPELALGIEPVEDPLGTLVRESVLDGMLLEGFNADVAEACAAGSREPVTRALLEQIGREERDHAAVSREIVAWPLAAHSDRARRAVHDALEAIPRYPRPTAVSAGKAGLLVGTDPAVLRAHGRLPDAAWATAWDARAATTIAELRAAVATAA